MIKDLIYLAIIIILIAQVEFYRNKAIQFKQEIKDLKYLMKEEI